MQPATQKDLFFTDLKEKFEEFHNQNPHVYKLLKQFTFQAIAKGHKHYGIAALFERIRWHTGIETGDVDFKLNNNYKAFYARMFHKDHPEHDGFFRTRPARCDQ